MLLRQQPEGEILGMGGPWIGKTYWNDQLLPGDYLMQPQVTDSKQEYAVLVGTNQRTATARSQVTFWLTIIKLADATLYRSAQSWPALYADDMVDGQIGFYARFQAGQANQKQHLAFKPNEFSRQV